MHYQVEARAREQQLLISLGLERGDTVADIGCGTGYFSSLMRERVTCVVGFDIDLASLRIAERYSPEHDFVLSDATQLPLRDRVVTKLLCSEVLEHVSDDARLTSECFRILKIGGVFVCSSPNVAFPFRSKKSSHVTKGAELHVRRGYSPVSLRELLMRAGFRSTHLSYALSLLGTLIVEVLERTYTMMYGPLASQSELARLNQSRIFKVLFPFLLFVVRVSFPKGLGGSILVARALRPVESGADPSRMRTLENRYLLRRGGYAS